MIDKLSPELAEKFKSSVSQAKIDRIKVLENETLSREIVQNIKDELFGSTGYKKAYDLPSLSPAFSKCNPPEDVGVEI